MGVEINKSRITARITHDKVKLDLLARGWIPIDAAEEQPFDIILDVGIHDDARLFQTIQVKTWTSLKTSSRVFNSFEPVSLGGKARNSYNYYDQHIDWIATVKENEDRVVYWNRDTYQYKTSSQLKKTTPIDFPINHKVYDYTKPETVACSIGADTSLESFMTDTGVLN
tara:strand:+ start:263 stop:769 length:507 start_codon:yes stop_codon:yes gene_type:complete